ncbi:hypothetical protein DFH09DRAFT_1451142 [Mycena vulgaris]|nr:hypothetical protein DFH09DRAFT_1451142 [Mycena vulgaris]
MKLTRWELPNATKFQLIEKYPLNDTYRHHKPVLYGLYPLYESIIGNAQIYGKVVWASAIALSAPTSMILSRHPRFSSFALLFLPFALCHPQWDAPNLAIPGPSSGSENATGLNLNSKNNTSPLAFALSLSSSIAPLLVPHALTREAECVVPGDIPCAGGQGCCGPEETCQPTFCCPDIAVRDLTFSLLPLIITSTHGLTLPISDEGVHAAVVPPQAVVHPALSAVAPNTRLHAVLRKRLAMFSDAVPRPPRNVMEQPVVMLTTYVVLVPRRAAALPKPFAVEVNVAPPDQVVTTAYAVLALPYGLAANPTLNFPYLKGHNDELIKNICKGMGGSNSDTLTYSGPLSKKDAKAKRAAQGCTPGLCDTKNTGLSCDEYPFASADEGGGNRTSGVVLCLPEYQNQWQGQLMRGWVNSLKKSGFKKGDKFNVKVTGIDCSKFKRDTETITTTGQGSMLWPPLESDPTNQSFVIVSLGDIPAGSYSVNVNLTSGTVTSAYLVDNEGEDLVNVTTLPTPGRPMQISFDLEYDDIGVGLALFTNDTRTNVSYIAVGTPSTTTATTKTTPTTPAASRGLVGIDPSWLSLFFVALLVAHVA